MNNYDKIIKYDKKCTNLFEELILILNKKYNKIYYPDTTLITIENDINHSLLFNYKNNKKIINLYTNFFNPIYNLDIDIINIIINYIITYNNLKSHLNNYKNNDTTIINYLYSPINYILKYFYEDINTKKEYELLILKEKYNNIYTYYTNKYTNINYNVKPCYNYILKSIILIHLEN